MTSKTERFRGKVCDGNTIVFDPVEGLLKSQARPGGTTGDWSGHIELTSDQREKLVDGNRYRLVLIDGRSGFVSVRAVTQDPLGRSHVHFHGTGSVRK